jgi:hypothetical protein
MPLNNYRAKSATIAGATSYAGVVEFSYESSGEVADMRSGAQLYRPSSPVTKIEQTLSITIKDAKVIPVVGQQGSTVLTSVTNTNGVASGVDLTWTCADTVVLSVSPNVGADGTSVTIRVQVNAGAADTTGVVIAGG